MRLYHGTSVRAMQGIEERGLEPRNAGVYLTDYEPLARGFCKIRRGRFDCAALCEVDLDEEEAGLLQPDWNMYEVPTEEVLDLAGCYGVSVDSDECWAEYVKDKLPLYDSDWGISLETVHSVVYPHRIPPERVRCRVIR